MQAKAIQNFKKIESFQQRPKQLQSAQSQDDLVSKLVDQGIESCMQIVLTADQDQRLPYAVSLMLSLSKDQLILLQQTQLTSSGPNDPLYIGEEFMQQLDQSQTYLLQESKVWSMPKSSFLKQQDSCLKMLQLKNLVIPESHDSKKYRYLQKNDYSVIELV